MNSFSYRAGAANIQFGRGRFAQMQAIVSELGCNRALILSTEFQTNMANRAAENLGPKAAGVFSGATMHTPVDVTYSALEYCESINADCIVSIGGGSTTGLGKAIAYRTGLAHVVIPTTYAGSEVTPILGQTENGVKTTITDTKVLPTVVLYDPELTDSLPLEMSIVSGLNAMAHAAEALYSKDRNPVSTALATQGLTAMKSGLERVSKNPNSKEGRDDALFGAWLCGTVLGQVGMALHHKICHTLGGSFNMPHAQTHAVMLPHTIGFNAPKVPELLKPIDQLFGDEPGPGLFAYLKSVGSPTTLKELGFLESDLDKAASLAARNPYWNPRAIDQTGLRAMLQNAFDGVAPPRSNN